MISRNYIYIYIIYIIAIPNNSHLDSQAMYYTLIEQEIKWRKATLICYKIPNC